MVLNSRPNLLGCTRNNYLDFGFNDELANFNVCDALKNNTIFRKNLNNLNTHR